MPNGSNLAPINETLGNYSQLFMLLSAFVYMVAFIFFALDLAKSNKSISEIDAAALKRDSEMLVGAGTTAVAQPKRPKRGAQPARADNVGEDIVNDKMNYTEHSSTRNIARIAVVLTWLGVAMHGFAVVARGVAAHRVPWGNMYEFLSTGALVVTVVYLVVLFFKDLRFMGSFIIGLVTLMLCGATLGFPTPLGHLVPALQSPWIVIHVSIAVFAAALFSISFAMNVLQLIQHSRMSKLAAGQPDKLPFMRLVPGAGALENFAYRINTISFVMWTFTVMAGAIWAEAAWGRYWGWDPKEVWSFVIWVVYAGYLHARATGGWTGPRSAWLSIIGYGCVIFNFTIVNMFFDGLHSYAGV
ncbi:c-type cytochrome biogenesis protein CcsB [Arthrobacter sp. MYb211]|uniref:c-type cytochrome biogenesis protein CcsB n=1 Tax=Micrococcaceae TaxID=1268 RepID=UPI000BB6BDAE|nr:MULTISPECIES: c-type cytochrome biogenesis protein CcsB [Micrococcaceae]PCC30136.1 c-type cytochrome biogenesis protein CcsB [Glutamicibacter sp. BW80]PQZ99547.1 c-type cytochrome biogenesis protein CcsB [Arthrobacter sp. MYb224]PRA05987.1 c-type cytochrome biogenesis protein CcsB [Arthrobacter sp. MYb229]PRA11242.1 c-type cytochrome biogenesis protein CcsB [Arthrobacter sp. MYb221]PRB52889.1 c-type cytochrome biogenesis protein CcsB [Arthrobacter sp. MYb216]